MVHFWLIAIRKKKQFGCLETLLLQNSEWKKSAFQNWTKTPSREILNKSSNTPRMGTIIIIEYTETRLLNPQVANLNSLMFSNVIAKIRLYEKEEAINNIKKILQSMWKINFMLLWKKESNRKYAYTSILVSSWAEWFNVVKERKPIPHIDNALRDISVSKWTT